MFNIKNVSIEQLLIYKLKTFSVILSILLNILKFYKTI